MVIIIQKSGIPKKGCRFFSLPLLAEKVLHQLAALFTEGAASYVCLGVQEQETDIPRNWLAVNGQCRKCRIFQVVRRGLSAEPLEPQLQKVIVDGIALGGAADKILVCQYVECCLDAAGAW